MIKSAFKNGIAIATMLLLVTACSSTKKTDMSNTSMGNSSVDGSQGANSGNIQPGSLEDFRQNVGDRVFFDTAEYTLTGEAKKTLVSQALWLNKYASNRSITIEGHADERGTREYNMALGARRANSVRNFLASQGIPVTSFNTISYGKERPAVEGSDPQAWAQNRRAVVAPN